MSKQKRGIFRRALIAAARLFSKKQPVTRNYADPRLRQKKRAHGGNRKTKPWNITKALAMPSCDPGTVTYRDWLVRHLGYDRRLADRMLAAWREDGSIKLPLPSDSKTLRELMR